MRDTLNALISLYDKIEDLEKDIKNQENVLAVWDENNPMMLDKTKYRNVLINDLKAVEMLKKSFNKTLKELEK